MGYNYCREVVCLKCFVQRCLECSCVYSVHEVCMYYGCHDGWEYILIHGVVEGCMDLICICQGRGVGI